MDATHLLSRSASDADTAMKLSSADRLGSYAAVILGRFCVKRTGNRLRKKDMEGATNSVPFLKILPFAERSVA